MSTYNPHVWGRRLAHEIYGTRQDEVEDVSRQDAGAITAWCRRQVTEAYPELSPRRVIFTAKEVEAVLF